MRWLNLKLPYGGTLLITHRTWFQELWMPKDRLLTIGKITYACKQTKLAEIALSDAMHEYAISRLQLKTGPIIWWFRYLTSKKYRLDAEMYAFSYELGVIPLLKNRVELANNRAEELASKKFFWAAIDKTHAMNLIRAKCPYKYFI